MNLNRRNYPPEHGIRLPTEEMKQFIVQLFEKVDMPRQDAELLGGILSSNDQRCLFSHGTRQVPYYLEKITDGTVNPRPQISVESEAPAALVMNGDGGLGYFPCYEGTRRIIEKAKAVGIAALTTRNHHHVGAAGNYSRLALAHDCIGLSASSQGGFVKPDQLVYNVVDASPFSIAVPAGEQPPLVMDMGGYLLSFDEALFERIPNTFLKIMGLSASLRALASVFPGAYRAEYKAPHSPWNGHQGAFIAAINVAHFLPLDELKEEMDRFIGAARRAQPLPGMERAELAGGNEWAWDKENREKGIPLGDDHRQQLQEEADKLGVETPFGRWENTRF